MRSVVVLLALLLGVGCVESMEVLDGAVEDAGSVADGGARDGGPRDAATPARDAATVPSDGASPTDAGPPPPPPIDLVAALADPFAPARLRPGRPFLDSSRRPEVPEGVLNYDHNHFVRQGDGWSVMTERTGPGAITRLWMTLGEIEDGRAREEVRVRLFVDGAEIDPDGGETGVTIGVLTGGSIAGLGPPFTLDRDGTSGGFVVSQPLHYQISFRAEVETLTAWTYYQVEGYDYDADARVVPFTLPPTAAQTASFAAADTLWIEHTHPGTDESTSLADLEAGGSAELSLVGPGVATELAIDVPRSARADMELVLVVDGVTAVEAPVSWVVGSASPAGATYSSALSAVDPGGVRLFYPVPFEESLTLTVRNTSATSVAGVQLRARVVAGSFDADLGRFRAWCGTSGPLPAPGVCNPNDGALRSPNHVVGAWSGARGQYVGHSIVQRTTHAFWCALETDHEVFIDGAYALLGTGLEDYYSAGFYFMNGPVAWALAGATGWLRDSPDRMDAIHLYRHHVVDPIPFEDAFRFEIENYVVDAVFEGCSFFYVAD